MLHIVSAFRYSSTLELALTKLLEMGIDRESIVAIPLNEKVDSLQVFDPIDSSDGKSFIDLACTFGMIFMLLGVIYGYIAPIGPIFLGLIGLIGGFLIGFLFKYLVLRKKLGKERSTSIDVFVTVKCNREEKEKILKLLYKYEALGIGIKNEIREHKD